MTQRTDNHRPASDHFDPEAYSFVATYDMSVWKSLDSILSDLRSSQSLPFYFASHQVHGKCGHCGTRLRYTALMRHKASGELLLIGETCLHERFIGVTKHKFQQMRKAALKQRERVTAKKRIVDTCAQEPKLAVLTYPELTAFYSLFVKDVAARFRKAGLLSAAQISSVLDAIQREDEWRIQEEVKAEEKRQRLINGEIMMAPLGNVEVAGVITKIDLRTDHIYGTSAWKMTIEDYDGFRVWGTLPRRVLNGFLEDNAGTTEQDIVGAKILFSACLERSNDDPYFAFAKNVKSVTFI